MYVSKVVSETVDDDKTEDAILDPDHILSVYSTLDVMEQYDALVESGDEEFADLPASFSDLPRETKVTLVHAAQAVFHDSSHEMETITESIREALVELVRTDKSDAKV